MYFDFGVRCVPADLPPGWAAAVVNSLTDRTPPAKHLTEHELEPVWMPSGSPSIFCGAGARTLVQGYVLHWGAGGDGGGSAGEGGRV